MEKTQCAIVFRHKQLLVNEVMSIQCQSESLLSSPVTRRYLCFPQLQAHIGRARSHSTIMDSLQYNIEEKHNLYERTCFAFYGNFNFLTEKIIFQKFAPRWRVRRTH